MEALEEIVETIQESMMNQTENQRRAQYAISGSDLSSLVSKMFLPTSGENSSKNMHNFCPDLSKQSPF